MVCVSASGAKTLEAQGGVGTRFVEANILGSTGSLGYSSIARGVIQVFRKSSCAWSTGTSGGCNSIRAIGSFRAKSYTADGLLRARRIKRPSCSGQLNSRPYSAMASSYRFRSSYALRDTSSCRRSQAPINPTFASRMPIRTRPIGYAQERER